MNPHTVTGFITRLRELGAAVPDDLTAMTEAWMRLAKAPFPESRPDGPGDPFIILTAADDPRAAALKLAAETRLYEQAMEDHPRAAAMFVNAQQQLATAIEAGAQQLAVTAVHEYLRPLLHEVITQTQELVASHPVIAEGAAAVLDAPAAAVNAYKQLLPLAERYDSLRSLQQTAARMEDPDTARTAFAFAEFRNAAELLGRRWPSLAPRDADPHPTVDRRERLLWIVAGSAQPWMPTVAERTAHQQTELRKLQEPLTAA